MEQTVIVVAFTGHRAGFDAGAVRPALARVLDDLVARAQAAGHPLRLCTSVAEGCDTLWLEVARERGVAVEILLPLEESEFAADFSATGWERAKAALDEARAHPNRDTIAVVGAGLSRPQCYEALGDEMLRRSRILVAVSDGAPGRGPGGTAAVVAQARDNGVPTVRVDAHSGAVSAPALLDRVLRPAQSTDRPTASPMPEDPPSQKRRAFISYRHESEDHRRAVMDFCQRLNATMGNGSVEIINDQTLLETRPAGPDEGWNRWSMNNAAHAERVIGIVSPGWFAAMDQKHLEPTPLGKGSAVEATVIFNRHTDGRTVSPWLRLVRLPTFPDTETNWLMRDIPMFLGDRESDIQALGRWLASTDAQGAAAPLPLPTPPPNRPKPAAPAARGRGVAIAAGAAALLVGGFFLAKPLIQGAGKKAATNSGPPAPANALQPPTTSPVVPKTATLKLPNAPAPGALGEVLLDATTVLNVRWCPPGKFTMGRTEAEFRYLGTFELDDEEARRRDEITIPEGYWIAETELTRKQRAAIRGATSATASEGDDLPEAGITHADAQQIAAELNTKLADTGWMARLPNEAEWEYACRAGTTTVFSFGDAIDKARANYDSQWKLDKPNGEPGRHEALKVGSFQNQKNPWNLLDVHGNVSEWCLWGDKPGAIATPPAAPAGQFPARGGGYESRWIKCTSGARSHIPGSPGQPTVGMRLLLAKQKSP